MQSPQRKPKVVCFRELNDNRKKVEISRTEQSHMLRTDTFLMLELEDYDVYQPENLEFFQCAKIVDKRKLGKHARRNIKEYECISMIQLNIGTFFPRKAEIKFCIEQSKEENVGRL